MAGSVVKATLTADARQFEAGFKKAESATTGFDKKIANTAGLAKGLLAGAAATAVFNFAKASVEAFSAVEQSAGSVESVFGSSADAITSKAAGAAEAFGLSASQFQESAALIGSMLKNQMGLSAEEAADRVDDLTGKAADMAATFGGTTSDAISAIGSLLRGERDPIERYGVSMNDAAIQARALELGLADARGEIGPTAKATAALDILNEQTADSTGQFARESDTLAGSQQILAANIENAKAAIGEQLAPAVGLASDAVNVLLPVVESLTSALGGAADAAQPLIDELTTLIGVAPEGGVGLENVGFALANSVLPFLQPVIGGIHNINELLGLNAEKDADAVRAMEDVRTHGLQPVTEAEKDLAGAIQDTIDIRQEAHDQIKGQFDAFFALTDAIDDQAEAQQKVNDLVAAGITSGPEYEDALKDVATSSLDVEDAQLRLLTSGGLTREEFEKQRVKMKLTAEEAQVLIDKYDIVFTPRSVTHTIRTENLGDQTSSYSPGRQHGGPVTAGQPYTVGEAGPETFVPNTSGRVQPNGRGRSGTPMVNHITINAGLGSDPNAIGRALVEALQRYERANGAVPIRTRSA